MKHIHKHGKNWIGGNGERGGLTIFTAVLILILMTLMLVYATRISVFETRVSSNDLRQKEAFHVAEAALEQGVMYLLSNSALVLSSRAEAFRDGTDFTRDGWLAAASPKWQPCPATPAATHPCGGDVAATTNSFYYDTDGDTATLESLPITEIGFPAGSTARVSALMCFVDINSATIGSDPCRGPPPTSTEEADTSLVLTLLAYGYSDCTDTTDVSTCTGEATVAFPISNYKKLSGNPGVPLTAKGTVPFNGTVEIVGNPNGGGLGIPVTTWVDASVMIDGKPAILSDAGSWQTCELEEWYHVSERPEGVICTDTKCQCGPGGNDSFYFLSWRKNRTDFNIGIDIIEDTNFPDDLFELYFDVPRGSYTQVKDDAHLLDASECVDLGPQSAGLYWINGGNCNLKGKRADIDGDGKEEMVIGSPLEPVILVSAAANTILNGGVNIFGVLFIFDGDADAENSTALLTSSGDATVYGAVIVDGEINRLLGTFQIVYNDAVIAAAAGIAGIGSVNGGWRDFGLPEIAWPVTAP